MTQDLRPNLRGVSRSIVATRVRYGEGEGGRKDQPGGMFPTLWPIPTTSADVAAPRGDSLHLNNSKQPRAPLGSPILASKRRLVR